ncbi:hypothetical protein AGMMS50256_31790 [Betaproteobacteria bacterium]|nr:hypothetical protein AGMMS50256_31790 [Betaproteobacteria bacterium]
MVQLVPVELVQINLQVIHNIQVMERIMIVLGVVLDDIQEVVVLLHQTLMLEQPE